MRGAQCTVCFGGCDGLLARQRQVEERGGAACMHREGEVGYVCVCVCVCVYMCVSVDGWVGWICVCVSCSHSPTTHTYT